MTAIERGCPYVFTLGTDVASFNVPTDANFVGYLEDVTGLDMYGIRENAQAVAAGDGGYHGPFWRDRRPFTISGFIVPTTPVSARSAAQDKLAGLLGECMRVDGTMTWTPLADGIQRGVYFRTQQPLRYTKGQSNVESNFLISCVARDWRVIKWAQSSASAALGGGALPLLVSTTNGGNADAAPILTVTGPINQPIITNVLSGKKFTLLGNVAAGQSLVIDLTQTYPSILRAGSDWSNNVDPLNTDYTIAVVRKATQNFQLSSGAGAAGTSAATALQVAWHDSWH